MKRKERSLPQERHLWTAHGARFVSLLLVEGIAAFVQSINLGNNK
jgi:hypothetical protein